ncbi:MAG: serine/threonine-protein phosphatase [Streptomyces sp.]|nr:serine/threonine-protein phosphatase [Streptomyces sp.]
MDRNMSVGFGERLLEELVRAAQLASPAELPVVLNRYAEAMGLGRAVIYLVDIQQRLLVPLVESEPELELDTPLAGWAYRTDSLRVEEGPSGGLRVWLPLADGAERLGVVELNMSTLDGLKLRRCRTTALLLALIITSKRTYSDTIAQRMRTRPMHLPTEMVRAFLPPRSIGTGRVVSTAVLEPAYELGGDTFDHAFTEDVLHSTILDGMGHNLASGLATSVAIESARQSRRDRPSGEVSLEPGNRILLYSDGVVESRDEAGEEFGLERFTDYIIRSTAAGQSAPEALRLLIHAILEHRHNKLSDDATILMFEWQPPDP